MHDVATDTRVYGDQTHSMECSLYQLLQGCQLKGLEATDIEVCMTASMMTLICIKVSMIGTGYNMRLVNTTLAVQSHTMA